MTDNTARVDELEGRLYKVDTEMRMISKTMQDVSATLKEIKEEQKAIRVFDVEKAMLERDIKEQKETIALIFNKLEAIRDEISSIKETNANSAVKINTSERFIWILVTAMVGLTSFFLKG